jgi:hypothetical protein
VLASSGVASVTPFQVALLKARGKTSYLLDIVFFAMPEVIVLVDVKGDDSTFYDQLL